MQAAVLASGAIFGFLAVLFGAFGAHRLKHSLSKSQLHSFETGVKFQFYHALLLLLVGFNMEFGATWSKAMAICLIGGTFLFSFSIYALCLMASRGKKLKYFGLLTPLGGLMLASGWGLLLYGILSRAA